MPNWLRSRLPGEQHDHMHCSSHAVLSGGIPHQVFVAADKQHLSAAFAGGSGGEMQEMDMESEPLSPHVGPVTLSVLLGGRHASFVGFETHHHVSVETPPSDCGLQVTFYCPTFAAYAKTLRNMRRMQNITGSGQGMLRMQEDIIE
jgi:hypothetical protein